MHVCQYLNQRVWRIGEQNGKSFKGVSKKKEKIHEVIEFKIEFLLQFTGCRKLLEKMPATPTMVSGKENVWFLDALKQSILELILSEKTLKGIKTVFFKI